MKVRDYLPHLYDNNGEMQALSYADEIEFEERIKPYTKNLFKDTFPKIATINGVENYEKILNINADPTTETLEFRRQRIILRLVSQLPFTERYMQQKFDEIIGVNQWEYTLDPVACTLEIRITVPGRSWYNELINFLEQVLPSNLEYEIIIYAASWQQVKEGFTSWNDLSTMTWDYIKSAMWL